MCDYDYDDSDVWVWDWVRARKPHRCCACSEPIVPGQIYHSYKSLNDGDWSRWIHCARCWSMCQALWKLVDGDAIQLDLDCGEVWENPPEDVAALAFTLPGDLSNWAETQYRDKRTRREVMP